MSKQKLVQKYSQGLSPQQIQFLSLLQIPVVSLEKRIEEELEENPALEEEEEQEEGEGVIAPPSKPVFEDLQIEDKSESLQEYLLKQLITLNQEEETLFLIRYLIDSLDENGFLSRDLYSISSDLLTNNNLNVSEEKIRSALSILQTLEPTGVGGKDLQECLLLQLEKNHPTEKTAAQIITDHYPSFSNKNFERIIKEVGISKKELRNVYQLIETLSPIPSTGFSKNTAPTKYIYPDFSIVSNNNQLELQLNNGRGKKLKLNTYYADLLTKTTDVKTKDFLLKKVEKAQWFKEAMKKREDTLIRVMSAIMEIQNEYLISGLESDLKPMKLADVADVVGMDISTISRVSNAKFLETHFGTFKVKELFSDAYRKDNGEVVSTNEIKLHLKELVLNEDKTAPFTDEQLAEMLGKDDYHIARRTVAKYREQLNIEIAKLRREV